MEAEAINAKVIKRARGGELLRALDGRDLHSLECVCNGHLGSSINPVESTNINEVGADITAKEAEIAGVDDIGRINDVGDVACNGGIETNMAAGDVADVLREGLEPSNELRPYNGLDFYLADLGGDNTLRELGNDGKLLLDDVDVDGLANNSLREDSLLVETTGEVLNTEEAIEVVEGAEATPVVERDRVQAADGANINRLTAGNGRCKRGGGCQSKDGGRDQREHF